MDPVTRPSGASEAGQSGFCHLHGGESATAEVAQIMRSPVSTLRYWRHLGSGPHSFRLGRRVLYRRDDLHAWIDAQRDGREFNRR